MSIKTELSKAVLFQVGPQHQQFYRPLTATVTGDTLAAFLEATKNSDDIAPEALAAIAPAILAPDAIPHGEAVLPVSLSETRFAFLLLFTHTLAYGTELEILTGFTSGIEMNEEDYSLDPNMKFYINGRTVVKQVEVATAEGRKNVHMHRQSHVVIPRIANGDFHGLRPADVVARLQIGLIQRKEPSSYISDTRGSLHNGALLSDVENNLPAHYLSTLSHRDDFWPDKESDRGAYLDMFYTYCKEAGLIDSHFYRMMQLFPARMSINAINKFTFEQLNTVYPRSPELWTKVMYKPDAKIPSAIDTTEHWGGSHVTTRVAVSLTHMLRGLLSPRMLHSLDFTFTNTNPCKIPTVMITNYGSTVLIDNLVETMGGLQHDIALYIGKMLSSLGVNSYAIDARVNLITTSKFEISVNEGPMIPYEAPSFCDGYFSPLLADNLGVLDDLSNNYEMMLNEFEEVSS